MTPSQDTNIDIIVPEIACNLPGLMAVRARRSPQMVAYRHFNSKEQRWEDFTWNDVIHEIARWQSALETESLAPGDRIGIMLPNGPRWVFADMAAMSLGLVVVPLYPFDRAENIAHCIRDSTPKLVFIDSLEQWHQLDGVRDSIADVRRWVSVSGLNGESDSGRVVSLATWLNVPQGRFQNRAGLSKSLATIVYSSGTSGRPKGVMHSHENILQNAYACLRAMPAKNTDVGLSFLPLAHTFERTTGYYLAIMSGSTIAYARSPKTLAEDLLAIKPTWLLGVPRIWERARWAIMRHVSQRPWYERILFNLTIASGMSHFHKTQKNGSKLSPLAILWPVLDRIVANPIRKRFGGRLQVGITAGAPLTNEVARTFIGLGINIAQGYGQNEAGPSISINRLTDNVLGSVGQVLPGVEVKIGERHEILVHSPGVMLGYWNDPVGTENAFTADGWLRTGDQGRVENNYLYVTGRLQDIIVLSTGRGISPSLLEGAILQDTLFKQVMLVGDGKPYLSVLVVLNQNYWPAIMHAAKLSTDEPLANAEKTAEKIALDRIASQLNTFPSHVQIRRALLIKESWSVENGMLTPTLQLKRSVILTRYSAEIAQLYPGQPLS